MAVGFRLLFNACSLFLLLLTASHSYSKPTLLTFVVRSTIPPYNGPQDVVAIDPSTGNVTKLSYHLPTADKLCARVDRQRGLIYVVYGSNRLAMYSMSDGREVESYDINYSIIDTYFTSWTYNADYKTLYGPCLKPDKVAINWNYTFCRVNFSDNGTGKLNYEGFITVANDGIGSGYCSNVHMNEDTVTSGLYWYTLDHSVIVKNVTTWDTVWSVEDSVDFDAMIFAALITGKVNQYAIVIHFADKPYVVAKLTSDGQETLLATLPDNVTSQAIGAVPWAYDYKSQMLYVLLQSTDTSFIYMLPDTLVRVDLTQPPERAVETVKIPLQSSAGYDPSKYMVFETHLVDM